jgi:AmiR/NasT family two-component response regulator
MRVVIAEDDSVVELGLQRMLDRLGHEVVGSAKNGEEAIRLVGNLEPDIAVLDIRMPGVDGLEAARRISENSPVAILMLTQFPDHALVKKAAESGAFAYLVKPVTVKQLGAAMDLACARFEDYTRLAGQTQQLKDELESRKLVDQARQILAEYLGISEGEALRRIQAESRRHRQKIQETAKAIIVTCEIMSRQPGPEA